VALWIGIGLGLHGEATGSGVPDGSTSGSASIVLPAPTVDAAAAVSNPDVTATADLQLPAPTIDVAAAISNPDVTATASITLPAPTIDASATVVTTFSADFTTQSVGGGSVSGYGLSFSRASSGHSVQTGTSTIVAGGTLTSNDVPRFGRGLDANNVALVFEETSTNQVLDSRNLSASSWSNAGSPTVTSGQTDPTGGTAAYRIQCASGAGRGETNATGTSAAVTGSAFLRATSGTDQPNFNVFKSTGRVATNITLTTTYQRVKLLGGTGAAASSIVPVDGRDWSAIGGVAAAAHDCLVDFTQREFLRYATEPIVTSGGAATRSGERLWLATGSNALASDGSLRCYVKLRPKGSSSDYANDMRFWHVDANNHAEVVASTAAVKITIGGTAYTTATAASWAANDLVEFWIAAGGGSNATVVKYRVNGGTITTLSTGSPPTQAAITIASTLDLLCNGTSNQFTAWVEKIEFYQTGQSPAGF